MPSSKQQRVQINRAEGLVKGQHAEDDHQHGAYQGAGRPVDMHPRDLAQADEHIGDDEDDQCG